MKHIKGARLIFISAAMLLLAAFIVLSISQFNGYVSQQISEKTEDMLSRSSDQTTAYIEAVLEGNFSSLEALAPVVELLHSGEVRDFLAREINSLDAFSRLTVVDVDGNSYTNDGLQANISFRSFVKTALTGERALSEPFASVFDSEYKCIAMAVPIYTDDGVVDGVLVGSFDADTLSDMIIPADTIKAHTRTMIVDKRGDVLLASRGSGFDAVTNILENDGVVFTDGGSIHQLRTALVRRLSETYKITDDGVGYYVSVQPFSYNGWSLVTVADSEELDSYYSFVSHSAVKLSAKLAAAFALCLCILCFIFHAATRNERLEKRELELSEERYRIMARDSDVIVFEANYEDHTVTASENFLRFFGSQPSFADYLSGKHIVYEDIGRYTDFIRSVEHSSVPLTCELRFITSEGSVWYSVLASSFKKNGHISRVLGKLTDIDAQKKEKDYLALRAQTDLMTGLYNKLSTEELISDAVTHEDGVHALIFIDIDDLKQLNDNHGHAVGDAAIMAVSELVKRHFRRTDIVGRVGGDEFMVFVRNIGGREQLVNTISALSGQTNTLRVGENSEIPVTCSIGAAICENNEPPYPLLFRMADTAAYSLKRSKKHGYAVYSPDMPLIGEDDSGHVSSLKSPR